MFADLYDANDRQVISTETAGTSVKTTTFAYNQTQVVGKTTTAGPALLGGWAYAWDAAGRLAVVSESDSNGLKARTTYGYDPSGIRNSATTESQFAGSVASSTVRTEFLVDHANFTGYQQVLRETHRDASGTLQRTVDYTFGLDEISQTSVDFTNGQPGEPVTLTFAHDGHGSVRALLDAAGAIATVAGVRQLFAYDAYGNALGFTPAQAATTLLYSGEQFDQRAQMQYLRARYYDAGAGRFVGLDPFSGNQNNPQTYNKYLYTHGDPVNFNDPTGWEANLSSLAGGFGAATGLGGMSSASILSTQLALRGSLLLSFAYSRMNLLLTMPAAFQVLYPRVFSAIGYGFLSFNAVNLAVLTYDQDARDMFIATAGANPAGTLSALGDDIRCIAITSTRIWQGPLSHAFGRKALLQGVKDILATMKTSLPRDAEFGIRGSLASGYKLNPDKALPDGTAPGFDPTRYDVDAFVVSDELAQRIPRNSRGHRSLGRLPEYAPLIEQVERQLVDLPGYDKNGAFWIRVYSQNEFSNKRIPGEIDLVD